MHRDNINFYVVYVVKLPVPLTTGRQIMWSSLNNKLEGMRKEADRTNSSDLSFYPETSASTEKDHKQLMTVCVPVISEQRISKMQNNS
jgi:hypothetical protein